MPYPVSPPALPPVVNVVLPEESHLSPSRLDSAVAPANARPGDETPACSGEACTITGVVSGSNPSEYHPAAYHPAEQNFSEYNALEAEAFIEARSTAEALGQPLTIGLSGGILTGTEFAPPAPRPTTFLELPDLDALVQARRVRPSQSSSALHRNQTGSELAQAGSQSGSKSGSEIDADAPAELPLPQQSPESIRLDLPTPDSEPGVPDASPNADSPNPASQETEPTQIEPADRSVPALPVPEPAPTGGEILTIPTPSPRTREEEDGNAEGDADNSVPSTTTPGIPIDPQAVGEVLEVKGDRQEFDEREQVFRADGNVEIRFRQAVLTADRVRVNIPNRVVVAEGNGVLTRGDQVLRGERFDYNFGLNQGTILNARGELLLPNTERDFSPEPATTFGANIGQPVTQRVSSVQPLQNVVGTPGGLSFGFGNRTAQQTGINRLRFEADQAEFDGAGLVAQNVRITNDPFSPPELELRSSRVTYSRLSPTTAEIRARNPRLVFDQGFSLPLLVNRIVLDNRRRNSGLLNFGFDERDRDGFYIERSFDIYSSPFLYFSLTPQILVQRAFDQGNFPDPDQFGLVANADFNFTPTTRAQAVASFSSLDFEEIGDNLRASLRASQLVANHTITAEYSYRNRLFNGSLGFQDIQSSIGLVVASPRYVLGDSLINLNYQGSIQYVNAQTDQQELFPLDRNDRDLTCIDPDDREFTGNGCADLTRYQAAVTLSRFFFLWIGTALPATPTEGLRYSPYPLSPYIGVNLDARGVVSAYSNGDTQSSLRGGVTLLGQFGRFSRPFLDYTAFSIGYANTIRQGESPYLFDRISDDQTISASLTQQIYGPLRFGVQVSYNLESGDEIDTVYSLEYSRRTYSISANYSTGRQSATLTFQLNDFNWTGDPGPFSGLGSDVVESGVIEGVN